MRRRTWLPSIEVLETRLAPASFAADLPALLASSSLGPVPVIRAEAPHAVVNLAATIDGRSVVAPPTVSGATVAVVPRTLLFAPSAALPADPGTLPLPPAPTAAPPLARADLFGIAGPSILLADFEMGEEIYRAGTGPASPHNGTGPEQPTVQPRSSRWSRLDAIEIIDPSAPSRSEDVPNARSAAPPLCAAPLTSSALAPAARRDTSAALPLLTGVLGIAALLAFRAAERRLPSASSSWRPWASSATRRSGVGVAAGRG